VHQTFAAAKLGGSSAITSDSRWDQSDGTHAPLRDPNTLAETDSQADGFQQLRVALRDAVIAYGRPVNWVTGDWHHLRIDKPFLDAQGLRLESSPPWRDIR
jgi:hypothetical protein